MTTRRGDGVAVERDGALERLLAAHRARFVKQYGPHGTIRAFFAPGRVNLMGAHLDYNGGPVMPVAIDRGTFIALRERDDLELHLRSTSESTSVAIDLATAVLEPAGTWADYPIGVIAKAWPRASTRRGLDVLFGGNLPVGAGLSSSASICVATALAIDRVWGLASSPLERAALALAAEREFVGVLCGMMDPYAVGMARAGFILWLDCKDGSVDHIPLDHRAFEIAVADSGVRRELAQSAFNQRVDEAKRAFEALQPFAPGATCLRDVPLSVFERHAGDLDSTLRLRGEHVVREVARTFEAREVLLAGDVAGFGRRMFETHRSLRDLYQVSVPELDFLVAAVERDDAVLGARLTGAGFGGCVVMLVRPGESAQVGRRLSAAFERRFGRPTPIEAFAVDRGPREVTLR